MLGCTSVTLSQQGAYTPLPPPVACGCASEVIFQECEPDTGTHHHTPPSQPPLAVRGPGLGGIDVRRRSRLTSFSGTDSVIQSEYDAPLMWIREKQFVSSVILLLPAAP
jgi:hypothetical protein